MSEPQAVNGPPAHPQSCPTCGAALESETRGSLCPACGASLSSELTSEQRAALEVLIQSSDEKLVTAGADSAEQAFGLGCLVIALPFVLVAVILFGLGVFNLIMLAIALVMAATLVAGLTTLLAFNARKRAIDNLYQREVGPEIEKQLRDLGLLNPTFSIFVHELLPENAPMCMFHPLPPAVPDASIIKR